MRYTSTITTLMAKAKAEQLKMNSSLKAHNYKAATKHADNINEINTLIKGIDPRVKIPTRDKLLKQSIYFFIGGTLFTLFLIFYLMMFQSWLQIGVIGIPSVIFIGVIMPIAFAMDEAAKKLI